jgi:hypothetical protein
MKPLLYTLSALAVVSLAAPAFAQTDSAAPSATTTTAPTDSSGTPTENSGSSSGAMAPAPHKHWAHRAGESSDSSESGTSSDQYYGVDTAGVREDVKAPYGGHNQAQADRDEAPVTQRLNEMQLQGNGQPQPH